MKKSIIIFTILATTTSSFFMMPRAALTATLSIKLPYAKGESFILVQGYNTPPTHIKKDSYALDFSQDGCEAYGKPAVAAAAGNVMFMSQEGYNGGYGTELIIDHGGNIVSRYAHMIPDSITVGVHDSIKRGEAIGLIGDTGLVAGAACATHPGTHLHFAMDTVNGDGTFAAYNPEPISGYTNMTAGKWYLSDNAEEIGTVLGAYDAATNTAMAKVASASTSTTPTSTVIIVASTTTIKSTIPSGGVSVITPSNVIVTSAPPSAPMVIATSTLIATTTDLANSTGTATTTPIAPPADSSTPSGVPDVSNGILFQQLDESINSSPSWYGDNWFDLGNGWAGTLNTLTLLGRINCPPRVASQIALQEFKDPNYTVMTQQFDLSDSVPFTSNLATTTFTGLSILLKPYFYYRLTTLQSYQNCSVILAGTASTTTGIAMWDNFIYGVGGVQSTSTFFPFMVSTGIAATSTLTPPPLTTPTNLAASFDEPGMHLDLIWSTSTDPDWPANPLHYEINYSTSSSLSDDGWTSPGVIPVSVGNQYLIGIRALDGYGAVSAIATTTWNFPPGFASYLFSPELGYANQSFMLYSTALLDSIQLFTTDFETSAKNPDAVNCSLELSYSDGSGSPIMRSSDNTYTGYGCAGNPTFTFTSSPFVLVAGRQYQWIFQAQTGNPLTGAGVQFYGTATDTAGGLFSDPSLVNAKFVLNGDSGVLFAN